MHEIILVIDDKEKLCKSLGLNFRQLGYKYNYCLNGESAKNFINQTEPDIVLLDQALGDEDGLEILIHIKRKRPTVPVIMITGYGSIDNAVKAIKIGASDYIQKPLNFEKLHKIVEYSLFKKDNRENHSSKGIITKSIHMKELLQKAEKLAQTNFPILIIGESGTGKERVAHYIHEASKRSAIDMNCINCAAFPENLLDNELFGHEKGSYTGAESQFQGIFERSDKSTLFMDEIGDMSLQTQAKILRTLQNNEIRRIGGKENISIDVRVIGATNKDLTDMIKNKRFREDLYYRINTAVIKIPPLRERKEDIIPLADFFLNDDSPAVNRTLSSEVGDIFINYSWPGNVREVRNSIHYARAMSSSSIIEISDLPNQFNKHSEETFQEGSLEDYEKTLIIKTLKDSGDNKKRAAELLNISRKTLYNKLEKYGL
ncbi:MAG: sigma-54-dependent Fis family transcriptional regulator [Spirochaetales bacterium]|nr:sigma-54-dependent Fis family transcriptional regulator [Spirochaetales bacterium]